MRLASRDPIRYAGGENLLAYVGGNPVRWVDPSGLEKFNILGHVVEIKINMNFLFFTKSNDLDGVGDSNFSTEYVYPGLSLGAGVAIKIDPPECRHYSPYIGFKNLGAGTNVYFDQNSGLRHQGLNLNIGISIGVPFGITVPSN